MQHGPASFIPSLPKKQESNQMITAAEILTRSLTRNGAQPVTDNDIQTRCEWCESGMMLGSCGKEKAGDGLVYRCPSCEQPVLIISPAPVTVPQISTGEDEHLRDRQWSAEASAQRAARGFPLEGWLIRSAEDLFVVNVVIPRMPRGSLRQG